MTYNPAISLYVLIQKYQSKIFTEMFIAKLFIQLKIENNSNSQKLEHMLSRRWANQEWNAIQN